MTKYYSDDDFPDIVIRYTEPAFIHVIRNGDTGWVELIGDNSYLRELLIGQGNTCMTEITVDEAKKIAERLLLDDLHSINKSGIETLF